MDISLYATICLVSEDVSKLENTVSLSIVVLRDVDHQIGVTTSQGNMALQVA
jgi:hypothetical protein